MTNEQILTKAIEKAITGGWKIEDFRYGGEMSVESVYYWFDDDHGDLSVNDVIWRHDFAKALWGEELIEWWEGKMRKINPEDEVIGSKAWQWHLRQMVIADDPIKYLGENL